MQVLLPIRRLMRTIVPACDHASLRLSMFGKALEFGQEEGSTNCLKGFRALQKIRTRWGVPCSNAPEARNGRQMCGSRALGQFAPF